MSRNSAVFVVPQRDSGSAENEFSKTLGQLLVRENILDAPTLQSVLARKEIESEETTLFLTLESMNLVTREEFLECIRIYQPDLPLGSLLVELGHISPTRLHQMLQYQAHDYYQSKLGELLVRNGILNELDLTSVLASQHGIHYEEPTISDCDPELLENLSVRTCSSFSFLPVRKTDGKVTVAFTDPMNQQARTVAARMLSAQITPVMASKTTINHALALIIDNRVVQDKKITKLDEILPVNFIDHLIKGALAENAAFIHVEPVDDHAQIKFRTDGQLKFNLNLHWDAYIALIARLKTRSNADVSIAGEHQTGEFEFTCDNKDDSTTVHVSILSTAHGEQAVLHPTRHNAAPIELEKLGLGPVCLGKFKHETLDRTGGLIIISGPRDSGKTTTLYSCIQSMAASNKSIVTVEDPIESKIAGVAQCSINKKLEITLESSLKQIRSQDADVIAFGEIRDENAARNALNIALSGSKVITTFCAEDSISCLIRLMSAGTDAFQHSSTLITLIAQRLLRRVCTECAESYTPYVQQFSAVGWNEADATDANFKKGKGCSNCNGTGYRGRIAVFELLNVSEEVRHAIIVRKTSAQIKQKLQDTTNFVSLMESALMAASRGITTLDEVKQNFAFQEASRDLNEIKRSSDE